MLTVDLSNIWCAVSLPDLLREEKGVFDAHMLLGGGPEKENGWLSFLEQPSFVTAARDAARRIRGSSRCLLIVGDGLAVRGARAALRLAGTRPASVELLFCGEDVSASAWQETASRLEEKDFSVLAVSETGEDPACLITLRSVRRMLEMRLGAEGKQRVFVFAPEGSSLERIARTEGYTCLPVPACPGGRSSVLNPAGLTMLAAAGLDVQELFAAAAEAAAQWDLRSFENPVWLYAGARAALRRSGFGAETVCVSAPRGDRFSEWWRQSFAAFGGGIASSAVFPRDGFLLAEGLFSAGQYSTLLELPAAGKSVPVEMDWKDEDGLNCLAGKDYAVVAQTVLDTLRDAYIQREVPLIGIHCDDALTDRTLGELLLFVELAAGLCARMDGLDPEKKPSRAALYGELDAVLARNSLNS